MRSSDPTEKLPARLWRLLLIVLIPLINGGWLSGPQSTFETEGPVAKEQLDVFYVTLWVTMVIFVLVGAVLAYATFKFKARSSEDEHAEPPEQSHGNPIVELSLIGASIFALVIIAVPTLKAIWYTYDVPEELQDIAYEVNATGYQWWFKFEYPTELVEGPMGEAPLVTANELVIPAGRPVRVNLRTVDVIHSFWVPKLAGKVDMIPNRGNHLWMQADEPGYFWGQCAEYCGESHAVMRFRVIALAEEEFNTWLENQKAEARTLEVAADAQIANATGDYPTFRVNQKGWTEEFDADPLGNWRAIQEIPALGEEDAALIAAGRRYFSENRCAGCHVVRGHDGMGMIGPDLTKIGSRTTIAAGLLENTPENLYRWITEPENVKPGNFMAHSRKVVPKGMVVMPGYRIYDAEKDEETVDIEITPEEGHALVAYLHSLK